jgi:hypothetical protein
LVFCANITRDRMFRHETGVQTCALAKKILVSSANITGDLGMHWSVAPK